MTGMHEHDAQACARASASIDARAHATDARTHVLTQKNSPDDVFSLNASRAGGHEDFSRLTERDVLDMLAERYGETVGGARRYALAEHPDANGRIADLVAVDAWHRTGYAVHGHEIKVNRADWLQELREPAKAETWARYCDRWWLVVSDEAIVRNDLPAGWGLLAVRVRYGQPCLTELVRAKKRTPESMPKQVVARLMRATAKTAVRQAESSLRSSVAS